VSGGAGAAAGRAGRGLEALSCGAPRPANAPQPHRTAVPGELTANRVAFLMTLLDPPGEDHGIDDVGGLAGGGLGGGGGGGGGGTPTAAAASAAAAGGSGGGGGWGGESLI
jgi:hypothetical protein